MHSGIDGTSAAAPAAAGLEMMISSQGSERTSFKESSDMVFAFKLRETYYEKGQVKHTEYSESGVLSVESLAKKGDMGNTAQASSLKVLGLDGNDFTARGVQILKEIGLDEGDGEERNIVLPKRSIVV